MYILSLLLSTLVTASSSSSSSSSQPPSPSPSADPPPIGALWTATWTPSDLSEYRTTCHTKTRYKAEMYKLSEMYPALEDYAADLKLFYQGQHYPGTWQGADPHGPQRTLLKMSLGALPEKLKSYLATTPSQRQFSVVRHNHHDDDDGVVFFAPGAIYPLLPLWVQARGECEHVFAGIEGYAREIREGGTVGIVRVGLEGGDEEEEEKKKKEGGREVEFWVEGWGVGRRVDGEEREEL